MNIVLYDDERARRFEPFALTRPVSELRAGTEIVRRRWETFRFRFTLLRTGIREWQKEGDRKKRRPRMAEKRDQGRFHRLIQRHASPRKIPRFFSLLAYGWESD